MFSQSDSSSSSESFDLDVLTQKEELESLSKIYLDEFCSVSSNRYKIRILSSDNLRVDLFFNYVSGYPSSASPNFDLQSTMVSKMFKAKLREELEDLWEENRGFIVLFIWVEHIRSRLEEVQVEVEDVVEDVVLKDLEILSGEAIVDRKSVFQAFIAEVYGEDDVQLFLKHLYSNKKIATATHNMYAYRYQVNGSYVWQKEDDGEQAGSEKILYVMNARDSMNLMVVVSRWYGGTNLGPLRFRYITECTANILDQYDIHKSNREQVVVPKHNETISTPIDQILNRIKWDASFEKETLKFAVGGELITYSELEEQNISSEKITEIRDEKNEIVWNPRNVDTIFS